MSYECTQIRLENIFINVFYYSTLFNKQCIDILCTELVGEWTAYAHGNAIDLTV